MSVMAVGNDNISYAQSPDFSIFDSFEKPPKNNEGRVVIHQSESVKRLVGSRISGDSIEILNGKTYINTEGYRIQVYSGNNQRVSRDEAQAVQNNFKELYPDFETPEIKYTAPFWRVYLGNFRSYEEAYVMLRDLRLKFPKIRNELYIVEDDIRLQLD